MSLSVSRTFHSSSFVASMPPVPLLSVSGVTMMLTNNFWDQAVAEQVNTIHSACHYLSEIETVDRSMIEGFREMIPELGTKSEPSATERLKLSRLMTSWSMNRQALQSRFPETAVEPSHERISDVAPSVTDPPRISTPKPPPPSRTARFGSGLFSAVVVPKLVAEAADSGTPRSASALSAEDTEDDHLFPAVWWDFSKAVRLSLKSAVLATDGRIREQTQDEGTHAQLLGSTILSGFNAIKETLTEARSKKETLTVNSARELLDRIRMALEILEYFRREEKRSLPLGQVFWRHLSENSDVRLAGSRLLMRDLQVVMEDEPKEILNRTLGHIELGIVESVVMPLFEGELPPNALDAAQGAEAAKELSKSLEGLPMTAKADLNPEQLSALNGAESVLKMVAQKMRGDAQSAYAGSFVREMSADLMRLASLAEMIQLRRSV